MQEEEDPYLTVAKEIVDAGFLLVAAGAGFSADSGLPVYKDIAQVEAYNKLNMDYQDLCHPEVLDTDETLFYGFWGKCFNDYKVTPPHEGYSILKKWRDQFFGPDTENSCAVRGALEKQIWQQDKAYNHDKDKHLLAGAFMVYTSNVDGHFRRFFSPYEVTEIHGSTDFWQCSKAGCTEYEVWRLPDDFRFNVPQETMRCEPEPLPPAIQTSYNTRLQVKAKQQTDTTAAKSTEATPTQSQGDQEDKGSGEEKEKDDTKQVQEIEVYSHYRRRSTIQSGKPILHRGHPCCKNCGGPARPNVLMFGDIKCDIFTFDPDHYVDWETTVEKILLNDLPQITAAPTDHPAELANTSTTAMSLQTFISGFNVNSDSSRLSPTELPYPLSSLPIFEPDSSPKTGPVVPIQEASVREQEQQHTGKNGITMSTKMRIATVNTTHFNETCCTPTTYPIINTWMEQSKSDKANITFKWAEEQVVSVDDTLKHISRQVSISRSEDGSINSTTVLNTTPGSCVTVEEVQEAPFSGANEQHGDEVKSPSTSSKQGEVEQQDSKRAKVEPIQQPHIEVPDEDVIVSPTSKISMATSEAFSSTSEVVENLEAQAQSPSDDSSMLSLGYSTQFPIHNNDTNDSSNTTSISGLPPLDVAAIQLAKENASLLGEGGAAPALERHATLPSLKKTKNTLVVLEMGCGKRVPSVRRETEEVCRDINKRAAKAGYKQCTLVRINPDVWEVDDKEDPNVTSHFIGIKSGALSALKKIDEHIQHLLTQRQTDTNDNAQEQ